MQFDPVVVAGEHWTFEHLRSFSFPYTIMTAGALLDLHIDVLFSCHCFTRKPSPGVPLPAPEWVYRTATEVRILDHERYQHSRDILPGVIQDFDARKILFASTENYMTIEATDARGVTGHYQVFFTVSRKEGVKRRLTLMVQPTLWTTFIARPNRHPSALCVSNS
jgi:hypothetical protein